MAHAPGGAGEELENSLPIPPLHDPTSVPLEVAGNRWSIVEQNSNTHKKTLVDMHGWMNGCTQPVMRNAYDDEEERHSSVTHTVGKKPQKLLPM